MIEKLIYGPYREIWAASDIRFVDGKWHENVPEPRIMGSTSPTMSNEDRDVYGRLFAAAPDLLTALTDALDIIETPISETPKNLLKRVAAISAAIAKAEGQP